MYNYIDQVVVRSIFAVELRVRAGKQNVMRQGFYIDGNRH